VKKTKQRLAARKPEGAINPLQLFSVCQNNTVKLVVTSTSGSTHIISYWVPRRDWLAIRRLARKFNRLATGQISGTFYKKAANGSR